MKKKLKFILALITVTVLLASLSVGAMAEPYDPLFPNGDASLTGQQDKSVFLAGDVVESDAQVNGLTIAAGNAVVIDGSSEYVIAAGGKASFVGESSGDVLLAGEGVLVAGAVGRDAYIMGYDVTVRGQVGRNLYLAGSRVTIDGRIDGDVYINADKLTLGSDVVIGGTLRYNSSADVTTADNSNIGATEMYESSVNPEPDYTQKTGNAIWSKVSSYLGLLAIAFVLLWLTPLWETLDKRYTGQPFGKFASAFGIGFGVLAGLPIAIILLMFTGIGLRLAFILLALYAAVLIASPMIIAFFLGSLIWRGLIKKAPCYWAELPIGLLLWWAAVQIPVFSFAAGLISAPLALGVITLLLGKKKAEKPSEPAALPEQTENTAAAE